MSVENKCEFPGCGNAPVPMLHFCKDHRSEETKVTNALAREAREEAKIVNADKKVSAQARAAHARAAKAQAYDCKTEPSDDEVMDILIDGRGLQNLHVIETVIDLGKTAAEMLGLTANEFFWTNGRAKLQESIAAGEPRLLGSVSDEQAKGMVISVRDLFTLYDFSPISWASIKWPLNDFEEFRDLPWDFSDFIDRKGKGVTFEEFHGLRYCSITDPLWSGRWIHRRDYHPKPHGEWAAFFPKKIPTLPMDYGTEDIKEWFRNLTDGPRRFFVTASRNSYKSSWQVDSEAVPYVLACPDVTILEISAVKNLSKKFIKSFRKIWTVEDRRKRSLFQMLWPEMMIYAEDQSDSTNFQCPMAKGLYPQPTMASSSVDASQVGERCLVLILDDPADEENEATPALRENLVEKIELIEKLKEPVGIEIIIGTPQAAEGDLYKVILDRGAKSGYKYLNYLIAPAWTLKPDAASKNIHDLVESDIQSFLFPSRLNWEFLKSELSSGSEKTFRRQYLLQWIDDDDPSFENRCFVDDAENSRELRFRALRCHILF